MEPDFSRHLKQRGGCTIPMFQLSLPCQKCDAARHNSVIGNQLMFANTRKKTGFAEWFYASHRMGPAQILLQISAIIA